MIDQLKSEGLMKTKYKDTTIKIINSLTKLAVDYKGNLNIVNKTIENIKQKHPDYINFLNNYFIKNKLKYFISGELDYSSLPIDCISVLENYNKIFKESLGKSKYIHWINYIHFIYTESRRIKNKIYNNLNQNIQYTQKFSKFGLSKYLNNNNTFSKDSTENIIFTTNDLFNNNSIINENINVEKNWLVNTMNSCRYDCFITIYGFCLRDIIKNNNINCNEFIIILDKTFEELLYFM